MIQRFDVGSRLSEMAVHNGVCYLAGQVAADADADVQGQTRQVLAAVDALLLRAGSSKSKILMCQIFLADMADFAAMNERYGAAFGSPPPARTTIAAAGLPKNAKVEIDCVAVGRDL